MTPLEPPATLAEPVTLLTGLAPIAGVYFLCRGEKIEFIGSSTDIRRSIGHLRILPEEAWDRVYYISSPQRMSRSRLKRSLIRKYSPPLNHFVQKDLT